MNSAFARPAGIVVILILAGSFLTATAQSTAHKVETTAKGARDVGHATASTAVKGASAVTDRVYKGKEGPGGKTLYIDKNDHKYYVDDKGKKIYVKSSQIRDKKEN